LLALSAVRLEVLMRQARALVLLQSSASGVLAQAIVPDWSLDALVLARSAPPVDVGSPMFDLSSPLFGRSTQTLASRHGSGGANGGFSRLYQIGGPRSIQLVVRLEF
jgi:hypothetical protein